jgi:lipid-binding SYLF domain-containing protein
MRESMIAFQSLFMAASKTFAGMLPVAMLDCANAATPEDLSRDDPQALQLLYEKTLAEDALFKSARAAVLSSSIIKAGLVFAAAYGEGVLKQASKPDTYYNSFTRSWGLQAGAQSYRYALLLMTDKAVSYFDRSDGWEIGVGPTVIVMNQGEATNLSTSTLKDNAYTFIFDQQRLMAGISIEETKISSIKQYKVTK